MWLMRPTPHVPIVGGTEKPRVLIHPDPSSKDFQSVEEMDWYSQMVHGSEQKDGQSGEF